MLNCKIKNLLSFIFILFSLGGCMADDLQLLDKVYEIVSSNDQNWNNILANYLIKIDYSDIKKMQFNGTYYYYKNITLTKNDNVYNLIYSEQKSGYSVMLLIVLVEISGEIKLDKWDVQKIDNDQLMGF